MQKVAMQKRTTSAPAQIGKRGAWAPAQMGRKMGCPGYKWKPGHQMGRITAEDRQVMGIAILSALSIAGLHAAICPSFFTLAAFGAREEARDRAMKGMYISLGLSTIASGGLFFVFDKWSPVIVAELTAVALFGIGVWALNSGTPETISAMQNQPQVNPTMQSPQPLQP